MKPKPKPETEMPMLRLVADIRAAVGDPTGKLMQDELVEHCRKLKHSDDCNRRRVEMLARLQCRMRDPERILVCDILANGQLMHDPEGSRYGFTVIDTDQLPRPKPTRIQRRRVKGWRMPPNTVSVCRPGKWGNPFHVADVLDLYDGDKEKAAADCVRSYRRWIEEGTNYQSDDAPPSIELIRSELRGKNLACFCPLGSHCHADVLLELANRRPDDWQSPSLRESWRESTVTPSPMETVAGKADC